MKVFLVEKIDKLDLCEAPVKEIVSIDVNSWFKNNELNPDNMNDVRQYIFNEWVTKKISSIKVKENSELYVAIICEFSNKKFINFLSKKFLEFFNDKFCSIILVKEKN